MGYLQIPSASLANFDKAIISLWFRVPAATLTTVSALTDSPSGATSDGWQTICFNPPLYKTIPLLTFGSLETTLPGSGLGSLACSPSFIGIDCGNGGFGANPPRLAVNLQTPNVCSFSNPPDSPDREMRPECYFMGGYGPGFGIPNQSLTVTADVWHHALISFDLSTASSITYANISRAPPDPLFAVTPGPIFYWAFDDVDMVGAAMQPSGSGGNNWGVGVDGSTATDRHILPHGLFTIEGGPDIATNDFTITVGTSIISSNGSPIGVPSSVDFVGNIYNVEMAELQFFTGVTLDTSVTANRRLFVDATGHPVDPASAAAGIGKVADVLFHGGSDFKAGINTGNLPDFSNTGTINLFSPGP